ncbi:MAG: glycosyltransferase family 4 protein [Gemmataceae bacterium]
MRLFCLVSSPHHVCCRYRLAAFRPHLAAAGHTLELLRLPASWWDRLLLFRKLRGEAVLIQRCLLPIWQLTLLRRWVRLLLADVDDAVWLRDSYDRRGLHHPRKLQRFAALCRAADTVLAGNPFLAAQVERLGGSPVVVPTCVDVQAYQPAPESPSRDGRTLVWVGSSSTLKGLERIADLLDDLAQAVPGLRLKVICDRFPQFRHLPIVPIPWSESTEAAEIAAADIGISWIPDDDWSRGKCGLKLLQYMAAGLPTIANSVGVHPQLIQHGDTGFLADNAEQWRYAVIRLMSDPRMRCEMGADGRKRVEEHFSLQAGSRFWLALLERLERKAA